MKENRKRIDKIRENIKSGIETDSEKWNELGDLLKKQEKYEGIRALLNVEETAGYAFEMAGNKEAAKEQYEYCLIGLSKDNELAKEIEVRMEKLD